MRIAVIGAGISGLAAAYYLSRKHEVSVFEREDRLGGHTHTITVDGRSGPVAVDTGFIVYNERTYPNLVKLFAELGVATQPSDMSFAVTCRESGFEYSSHSLNGFFAQRSNLFQVNHYRLLAEIVRFNREAPKLLDNPSPTDISVGDFVQQGRYAPVFTDRYLYPMASAVWSMSREEIREFPALTLICFFANHGMLGINTHPQWRVVRGGSQSYIPPLTAPYRDRCFTGVNVQAVYRDEQGVTLRLRDREEMRFDHVVFCCHGNQVLPMLAAPSVAEQDILANFRTSWNHVWLHTDSRMLPKRPSARASWNYNLSPAPGAGARVTYHMNRLQTLTSAEDYCVTLNAGDSIDPAKVLLRLVYHHPLYTRAAIGAQAKWSEISGRNRTHYGGAYWFYGFHEDGLNSALRVARTLGVEC